MALEIERKFLVAGDAWRRAVRKTARMRQGYLCEAGGKASVRVRVQADAAWLNIKAAVVGSARAEYEYEVPIDDAQTMLDTLCIGCIDKRRHYLDHQGHTWEIDEFDGDNAGLVIAEIELARVDESFARPAWLGAEVTDELRYYNHALALQPYRHWPDTSQA